MAFNSQLINFYRTDFNAIFNIVFASAFYSEEKPLSPCRPFEEAVCFHNWNAICRRHILGHHSHPELMVVIDLIPHCLMLKPKDGEVLDGGWDFIPTWTTCSRHNTSRFDWTQHTTCKLQAAFSWGNLLVPGSLYEKPSYETSLDLDSCFGHH